VILTAYIDESGTHGTSPVTIMAGAYGSVAQWEDVEARIQELEQKRQFSMFHSTDLKSGQGSFKGWSSEQRLELVKEFIAILADRRIESGFIMQIVNADYEKYYRMGDAPAPAVLDTKYGFCFRGCLTHLLQHIKSPDNTLNMVMESGHRNSGDARRIFDQMQTRGLKPGFENLLGTLAFTEKKHCRLLGIADFLAYTTFMGDRFIRDGKMQPVAGGQRTNVVSLQMTPEQLGTARQRLASVAPRRAGKPA
jgi:Protein of unknown function (DUF3800)